MKSLETAVLASARLGVGIVVPPPLDAVWSVPDFIDTGLGCQIGHAHGRQRPPSRHRSAPSAGLLHCAQ
jgi:hypothetical protein